jgi:hypothetical protein
VVFIYDIFDGIGGLLDMCICAADELLAVRCRL